LLRFLLATSAIALVAAPAASAQPPFEPNDNLMTGWGPLAINQTYTAATETSNDRDYFYFYVNTPTSAQISVTLKDLGGGPNSEGWTAITLQDSHGDYIYGGSLFADRFDYDTFAITLTAGKYYLEAHSGTYDYGDAYSISTSGTDGAFGEYGPIAAQCSAATASVAAAQAEVGKGEAKLRKANARVRRTRYSRSRRARRRARAAYARAKAELAAEKANLRAATSSQEPWCTIPQ